MNPSEPELEVQSFKIARVGDERRKRRGAGFFLRGGGGSKGGLRGLLGAGRGGAAGGGAEAAGGGGLRALLSGGWRQALGGMLESAGLSYGRAGLILLITSVSALGALAVGERSGMSTPASRSKPRFAEAAGRYAVDPDSLPGGANGIPNSLGYVTGSPDGLSAEERERLAAEAAKKAADEEAARAAEEAAAKAAEEAAAKGSAAPSAPIPEVASYTPPTRSFGGGGSAFGSRPGGMSGVGAGGSRSVTSGFAPSSGLSGGSGGSGSLGGGGKGGKSSSFRTPGRASTSGSRLARSNAQARGFARRQLANANGLSRQAVGAGRNEASAANASAPFDGVNSGGTGITGGGIGGGGSPGAGAGVGAGPGAGAGAGAGTGAGTGAGPGGIDPGAGPGAETCDKPGYAPKEDGTGCEKIPEPEGENVTPYQWAYDWATRLLKTVAVLSAAIMIATKLGQSGLFWANAWAYYMRMTVLGLGAAITALGATVLLRSGDKMAGGILAATGAFVMMTAWSPKAKTFTNAKELNSFIRNWALKSLITSIAGHFAASKVHAATLAGNLD